MFTKTKVCTGVLAALGGTLLVTSLPVLAQGQSVEITGSRIKRVDAEGALPITNISREEIQASGATTVAEFMRSIPFAATGNFRPQSGSSAQSLAEIDLRGLGAERTLVLIDGRRAAKGPMIGDRVDVNIIPMAMIERVEILTDSGSAIYGSDAIGGVVNFITRKDFQGIELMAGASNPNLTGGDRDEGHVIIGVSGDKGRIIGGFSTSSRDIVFHRNMPYPVTPGASVFGNNYTTGERDPVTGVWSSNFDFTAWPGGCTEPNFFTRGASCRYDFTQVNANEAQVKNQAVFVRGDYEIAENWSGYMAASVSRVDSFGRYAPTPARNIFLAADSPLNPAGEEIEIFHRFAAAGNRDSITDNNYYNVNLGAQGTVGGWDIDFGYRRSDSQYYELGQNYIVSRLANEAINSGAYDLTFPSQNPPDVLNGIKATISRDSRFKDEELYANATVGLFKMGGGTAQLNVGGEYRTETFKDKYDSLQEAGAIEGSAGNSAGGERDITAVFGEMLMPISQTLEASLAARYERYSDYGSDFSPKLGVKWKPMPSLALRGSWGKGFRAPSLPILTANVAFSATDVVDPVSCAVLNPGEDDCQVNDYISPNPNLDSEKSTQFSFGGIWEATNWLSVKADYWNVKIDGSIKQLLPQDIVDRDNGTDPRPIPPGLGVSRNAAGVITRVDSGYANEGTIQTDGIDISLTGTFPLGNYGRLVSDFRWTRVLSWEEGGFDFSGSFSRPEDRAMWVNNWNLGNFSAAWNINFTGRNEFAPNRTDTRSVGSYVTHDIQVGWNTPIKGGTLVFGIVNIADKLPALVGYENRDFNFNLYDAYGRTPYIRYTQRF